jgi:hypothetical protein
MLKTKFQKQWRVILFVSIYFVPAFFQVSHAFGRSRAPNLGDIRGMYAGVDLAALTQKEIVSFLPDTAKISRKEWLLKFQIQTPNEPSSGKNDFFEVWFYKGSLSKVKIPGIRELLSSTGDSPLCSKVTNDSTDGEVCFSGKKLNLKAFDKTSKQTLYDFELLPINDTSMGSGEKSLEELLNRSKFQSFASMREAEQVFQSKKNISVARGRLLPGLSVRAIVGIFTVDAMSVIGAALPFIFPNNWYRLRAAEALYRAETKSFSAFRGNVMNSVEGLYYTVLRDQMVLGELNSQIAWMESTQENLANEEDVGTIPKGSTDYYSLQLGQLKRDQIGLAQLVKDEYAELAQSVALSPQGGITTLKPVTIPDFSQLKPIDVTPIVPVAQSKSYELQTFDELKKAAKNLSNMEIFDFLSAEGAGTFGFATPGQVAVSRSKQRELQIQQDETRSIIAKQLVEIGNRYNSALDAYTASSTAEKQALARIQWVLRKHLNGDDSDSEIDFAQELSALQMNYVGLVSDRVSAILSFQIAKSQLERATLSGFYEHLDDQMPW